MLTPVFELKQDDNFVTVIIKAPYTKVSDAEIHIDGKDFRFYSKPYFLRLTLPGYLIEDGRDKAHYNADTGEFVVHVPKEEPGKFFDGLDMLTKLLAPSGVKTAKQPLIQVIDGKESTYVDSDDDQEVEIDWSIDQTPYKEESLTSDGPMYGFANQRSGVFKRLQTELHDVIDLKEADFIPASERANLKFLQEQELFDQEHYLGDLYEDESVEELLKFKPTLTSEYKRFKSGEPLDSIVTLTDDEKEAMLKLPRKEYILDDLETQTVYLGLLDILYAYAYNLRTTQEENNVESGWTICKLSSTLSWLQSFTSLKDVTVSCLRRSLVFPLYRHWKLAKRVLRDTRQLLQLGKRRVLKCLLEIQRLLSEAESRYILNDLYITDYCVWIQSASDLQLKSLASNLKELHIMKVDLDLDLDDLEAAASLALEEEIQASDLADDVEQLSLRSGDHHSNAVKNTVEDIRNTNEQDSVKNLIDITSKLEINQSPKLIEEIDSKTEGSHSASDSEPTR